MTPFSASTSAWITSASLTVTAPLTAIRSTLPSTVVCSLSCVIWAEVIRPVRQHPGERLRVGEEAAHGLRRQGRERLVGRREDGERTPVGERLSEARGVDGGEQGLERPSLSRGFQDVVRHASSFLSG
jgi:hypothetical protein